MDFEFYLEKFQAVYSVIDKKEFGKQRLELFVGVAMKSVVIKTYKPEWSDDFKNPVTAKSRIFFSVWVSDETIKENKIYYNIHAFKLRQLKGYKITSRDFAERFRNQFKKHHKDWENISTEFGPLTLMQGWKKLENKNMQDDVAALVSKFLTIAPLVDKTLDYYKI